MKKFLLLLIICLNLSYESKSQTSKIDTICLPVTTVKKIFAAAEQKKLLEKDIVIYKSDISILKETIGVKDARLNEKDTIIQIFKEKDILNEDVVRTYQSEIKVLNDQKALYKKELRKQRIKTKLSAAAGLALGIGVFVLLK